MHLFGMMSLIFLFFSFFSGFLSIYEKLFLNINLNNNGWFFISIFSFLASILLFSFGIIIDLLIKINYKSSTNDQKVYIRNIYNQ